MVMKNVPFSEVFVTADLVEYGDGQVVSKTLLQNESVSITVFAFDKDEEISTHRSGGDAYVICLDGKGRITIDGKEHILSKGESIVMPAGHPHAVFGIEKFKMLLTVCFPPKQVITVE